MKIFTFVLLLSVTVLSACGFQLRGNATLPAAFNNIYIEAETSSHLVRDLERLLLRDKVIVSSNKMLADFVIKISDESIKRRLSSVGLDAKSNDYRLQHSLIMGVSRYSDADTSRSLLSAQKLSIQRDYKFDPNAVLGSSQQEQTLYTEMRQQLVSLIMLRLRAVKIDER